jgi:hypothetical protein
MQLLAFVPTRQDKARADDRMQCFIAGFAMNNFPSFIFPSFIFDRLEKLQ